MIAKMVKGSGFRGALEYDLQAEKGQMLDTNMAGENPRELAKEFGEIRKLRPNLNKAVLHVSLAAAPGESLTDKQWTDIGHKYLRGMGFKNSQFVITRHTNTDHQHIHILANRIGIDGAVVSDGMDFKRQENLMREIERSYGLKAVEPSHEAERKALSKGEIEEAVRTGAPSTRMQLQQLCDAAAKGSRSMSRYIERLEVTGVEVIPTTQLAGAKLSGLQYRLDGVVMKGSDLGKSYSPAGLEKRGIGYEQDRDGAAIRSSQQREAGRRAGPAHEPADPRQAPERGRTGLDLGAAGTGHGRTDGGNPADAGLHREEGRAASRDLQPADQEFSQVVPRSRERSAAGIEQPARRRQPDALDALRPGDSRGRTHSTAHERILALAGPANSAELNRQQSSSGAPETRRNRSLEAVERQVASMGVELVEIQILNFTTGKNQKRQLNMEQLRWAIPWLKRENALGSDIFVRPHGDHGLVFLQGISAATIEEMKAKGYAPALTVEDGTKTFDAWLKLSEQPLPEVVRKLAEVGLSKSFGADMETAGKDAFTRLAGFTDQSVAGGNKPYVLAHEGAKTVAHSAASALRQASAFIEQSRTSFERGKEALKTKNNEHSKQRNNDRGMSR
ncbi:MAG: relaxase/mobilization nuclease domain-containing protein [Comamonas sp.]|nr:relaxase/mobilization nuclease domain-containing protein [Candidatus Comamonas equi]